ncbi:MAG: tRNA pseudouridine(55) synthase TruB [Acidobacteriales bacterium]|nr:tRNA pseudouridine(55) synthase TruB [Terriglobales bacterium]
MPNAISGVLLIDKPSGMTSHDVVNRVRRTLGQRSVGHLGALDPLATGILPIVLGKMTRLAQFYANSSKTYDGCIQFGVATDTYDAEGRVIAIAPTPLNLSFNELRAAALEFVGVMDQTPPPFSAKKVDGIPAYKLARKQKGVFLRPVRVQIESFEISSFDNDRAQFQIEVSSGTYVRSIAHELGRRLRCGGHLESLRRSRFAEFALSEAHSLQAIDLARQNGRLESLLICPRELLPQIPSVSVADEVVARIQRGQRVTLAEPSSALQVKVYSELGELAAIATRISDAEFHAGVVFAESRSAQESIQMTGAN